MNEPVSPNNPCTQIEEIFARRRREIKASKLTRAVFVMAILACVASAISVPVPGFHADSIVWLCAICLVIAVGIIDYIRQCRPSVVPELTQVEDVRALSYLVDGLDDYTRDVSIQGLVCLLPRLTPMDANTLNDKQVERLCRELMRCCRSKRNDSFAVEILRAFEKIGCDGVLNTIQEVLSLEYTARPSEPILEAAKICEAVILDRIETRRNQTTLLRASTISSLSKHLYLSPVLPVDNHSTDSKLLRSYDGSVEDSQS